MPRPEKAWGRGDWNVSWGFVVACDDCLGWAGRIVLVTPGRSGAYARRRCHSCCHKPRWGSFMKGQLHSFSMLQKHHRLKASRRMETAPGSSCEVMRRPQRPVILSGKTWCTASSLMVPSWMKGLSLMFSPAEWKVPAAMSLPSKSLASTTTTLSRSCLFVYHSCYCMKLPTGYSFLAENGVVLTETMELVNWAFTLLSETELSQQSFPFAVVARCMELLLTSGNSKFIWRQDRCAHSWL